MKRRDILGASLGLLPLGELLAQGVRTGFEAQGLQPTLAALGLAAPQLSRELLLEAPDIAENGAAVSLTLSSKLPGVKRFYLLAEKNPATLLAWYELSDALEPKLTTQIKLAQSSMVYGIAQMSDNKLLMAQKDVKVTLGGLRRMSQATLIRARMSSATTALVRIRMKHEMESGQRKDAQGRSVPAWHIAEFALSLNGRLVLNGQLGTGISKDPFLEFTVRGVKAGDSLKLDWTDSKGDKRSDSAAVLAG